MTLRYVSGDPLLTQAAFLAFGHNARGRLETTPFESQLHRAYPAAFSSYHKQCRQNNLQAGDYWTWHESRPRLMFMVIRETSVGATRLRYVQSALFRLARDYRMEGIHSVAIAPLGDTREWAEIQPLIERILGKSPLEVTVYEQYQAGVHAEIPPDDTP